MKKFLFLALAALTACTPGSHKAIILYYSQTGTTEALAQELQRQTGADIARFDVVEEYNGNFEQTLERCQTEKKLGFLPTLKPLDVDLDKYDMVYLCFPVWFGTYATPVKSLYREYDLSDKIIVPMCTFGSGGSISSRDRLRTAMPYTDIRYPFGIRQARIGNVAEELHRFLVEGSYIRGRKTRLPEFEEHEDFSLEDAKLFHEACDGYPFPLGEPVGARSRVTPWGTEYIYAADSVTPDGKVSHSSVYVLKQEGKSPEFTQVIR